MNIAKAIKDAREAKGMTLAQLEQKTTLTKEYLQEIEEGKGPYVQIPRSHLHAIAGAFETPLEVLSILGIEDKDIKKDKKVIADALLPSMQGLLLELLKEK